MTIEQADEQLYKFVQTYIPPGNTITNKYRKFKYLEIYSNLKTEFFVILDSYFLFCCQILGKGCVAGNSVYMDKWHVIKYLPKFNSHLHYRLIDVSTLKELCRLATNFL